MAVPVRAMEDMAAVLVLGVLVVAMVGVVMMLALEVAMEVAVEVAFTGVEGDMVVQEAAVIILMEGRFSLK